MFKNIILCDTTVDARDESHEWEVKDAAELKSKAPGMYNLLTSGITSMKLLSTNGVLPGAGPSGATSTYNPTSQTCNSGCGLDGSGCGSQGNEEDLDMCSLVVDDTPAPTPTSFTPLPTPSPLTPAPTPTLFTPAPTPDSDCKDDPTFRKGKKQRKCSWFGKKKI